MQRILDPAQIEAFAERSIPRVRLCEPASLFAVRALRLRALAENHALGDYLRLMAVVAAAQQAAIEKLPAPSSEDRTSQLELAHAHRMPLFPVTDWQIGDRRADGGPRAGRWRSVLNELCTSIANAPGFPPGVRAVCERIVASDDAEADSQASLLLSARTEGVDAQAAPFIMAALQVYWSAMAASLEVRDVTQIDVPGVCPVCGTLPVSSIVRSDKRYQGYRYLHCALCATEWHMVRIVCSHCQANEGIAYHSIEGGSEAIRAESCGKCHTYRKILYQEKDPDVEPVADDLASLALDLLMTEEGYHRGSGNPLLWQNTEA
jgi:FdhE protein